jgi:hypothetical protein
MGSLIDFSAATVARRRAAAEAAVAGYEGEIALAADALLGVQLGQRLGMDAKKAGYAREIVLRRLESDYGLLFGAATLAALTGDCRLRELAARPRPADEHELLDALGVPPGTLAATLERELVDAARRHYSWRRAAVMPPEHRQERLLDDLVEAGR